MAVVTGAILVVGAIHLLSWRSVAREPKAPLLITQGSLPSPAANNRPANPQDSEQTGPTEGPAGKAAPPAGRARFGGALPERVSSRPAPPAPVDIAPARFEAVVYEVEVPENRIADLDAQALEAKAATVRDLATALETFGRAKILYKIDQTANLYGETITLTTTEPMITATRQMDAGGSINQQVGLIVNLLAMDQTRSEPVLTRPFRETGATRAFGIR
jgi:hypothetical protein